MTPLFQKEYTDMKHLQDILLNKKNQGAELFIIHYAKHQRWKRVYMKIFIGTCLNILWKTKYHDFLWERTWMYECGRKIYCKNILNLELCEYITFSKI